MISDTLGSDIRRANANYRTGTSKVELERSWNGRSGKASREAALLKTGGGGVVRTDAGEVKQRRMKAAGTGTDNSLPAEWIPNGTGVLSDSGVDSRST